MQHRTTESEKQHYLHSIFITHYKKLYATAFRITQSEAEAEDVVQDVFVKAHKSLDAFREDAQLSTWLYRMTVNACLDWKRKIWRRSNKEVGLGLVHNDICDTTASKLHDAERHEVQKKLHRALGTLKPPYRAILVLRDFEHRSYQEIADVLNIDAGTVASRLSRAREKMRHELKKLGIDESYGKA